jgi:CheY-like chemotaxis protein
MSEKHIGSAYCYRIKGMFVPYDTPATIEQDIDNYINNIGKHTNKLEDYFVAADMKGFIGTLNAILEMLQKVYAKQCISFANALIDAATNRNVSYCQKLMSQAIADFLLLSIEMQKAQNLNVSNAMKYRKVEKNEEIASGLAAISRMLNIGNYKEAASMAHDMRDMADTFKKIEEMIDARQYDRAKELSETMEKENIKIIQQGDGGKATNTILAVDDRPDMLATVSAALRNHYKVLGAPSGKIALQVMEKQHIDLFYLDIDMPEMDGFELLQKIRMNSKYAKTPAIYLTANASREYINRGIALGVDDYIVKPSNHVNLIVKARKYMDA